MTDPNTSVNLVNFSEFYEEEFNYTDFLNITYFVVDDKTVPCQPLTISGAVSVAVCVFYIVVFLQATLGNLTVVLVIVNNIRALSPSDVYLFHLTLADSLLALALPFYATAVVRGWLFGDIMCKLLSVMKEASFYTSILFLVCISVDRYTVIVWAVESRMAQRLLWSWHISAAVWLLGVFLSLPALYNEVFALSGSRTPMCAERFHQERADELRLATRVLRHLLGFLLPLGIMTVCYGVTVARLLRTRSFRRHRAMRLIVLVVLAFLLCWMPYHVVTVVDTLLRAKLIPESCKVHKALDVAIYVTQSLGLLHCCINPVLYAFVGAKFRTRLFQLLHKAGVLAGRSVSVSSRSTSLTSEATSNFL
ncbi:C-X-C chemokine receptor type 2 [Electrophorus electricus]|uniref:G-protein coupled receptors family 1 profile domain-containing protein n=1 Tax=Electrophorus electricus TaxID=8005 RepID=A0A4W4ESR4_ELEEL|nr:C-X-C chemokine receptor type 2 [Electrophorus electricus]